ncbi:MAG: hypothetical protein IIU55_08225, partial [Paludibacteraceae bacterium]|nr:hypothetical protein [Paludibacteraceae bacterium]
GCCDSGAHPCKSSAYHAEIHGMFNSLKCHNFPPFLHSFLWFYYTGNREKMQSFFRNFPKFSLTGVGFPKRFDNPEKRRYNGIYHCIYESEKS